VLIFFEAAFEKLGVYGVQRVKRMDGTYPLLVLVVLMLIVKKFSLL
jgi:hypothetical protein